MSDLRADIVVLGGGIAGISAAAELAAEADVLLLEAEDALGTHASGRSAAMFIRGYGNATVRALNAASAEAHRAAGVLSPRDLLLVCGDATAERFDAEASDLGAEAIALDTAHAMLPILEPGWLVRAAHVAEVDDVDTDRLIQHYRRRLVDCGGTVATGARVTQIERADGHWHVAWSAGSASAPLVINAAGAWADAVAGMAGAAPLGLAAYRRSMAQLAAPGGHDVTRWPFTVGAGETWYAKPDAGRWLVSPADEEPSPAGECWPDDLVLAEGLARYQEAVTIDVTRPLTTWAGLRTFAADRTPICGHDPRRPGFFWCAGQGGYGFQIAPAMARLTVDLAAGRRPDLPGNIVAGLSPERFG